MENKTKFAYAKLFDPETGKLAKNFERTDLVMGPETERRFKENADDCAVTVCCITYNHEELIRQALDSFLMQKTNFRFKIFVGEDHGPDGTADIVREYAEKYPDQVFAFCREQNMGAQRNLVDLCMRANSPYIAFCEGDDYWIDEYKLQKQYDYMQSHPDVRMCYTRTQIEAPEDWHLNSYYSHNEEGRIILPDCNPAFIKKEYYHVDDFSEKFSPDHTSNAFFRWNYDLKVPEWYYQGIIGDTPMTMMQMGIGKASFLPDVTSVYRRSDVGVFMHHSIEEHFIQTRLDYVRYLSGVESYFCEHHDGAYKSSFRNRIYTEIDNYICVVIKRNDRKLLTDLLERYPEQTMNLFKEYGNNRKQSIQMKRVFSEEEMKFISSTRSGYKYARMGLTVYKILHTTKVRLKNFMNRERWVKRFCYWKNSFVPKEKDLWVITSFRHRGYMDNAMYFYEYMVKHHPEIRLVWVTTDQTVIDKLTAEGKPVVRMDSPEGTKLIAKAAIAITDHNVMSDYTPQCGFNDKTKVVQLWHGVGFKKMGDGKKVTLVRQEGVQYSNDILIQGDEGILSRIWKKIKYIYRAPFRELFEQYFMLVCPGQERIDMIAKKWNVQESAWFMAGHPRDIDLHIQKANVLTPKIMYAPTFRYNSDVEMQLVERLVKHAPQIQGLMEELNGEFYVRMHPHTWRNYEAMLNKIADQHSRILIDREKDVYTHLGEFSLLITDYSSIGLDLAQLDRPVLFYCPDYEWFIENEAGFGVDFPKVIPGVMTDTWEETLAQVKLHIQHPDTNAQLRRERIAYFFDPTVNGPDNSERIAQEIKRRLGL